MLPGSPCWAHALALDFVGACLEIHASTNFLLDVLSHAAAARRGGGGGDAAGAADGAITPQAMARICSGSDLTASYFGPARQRPSAAQLLDLVGAKAEDDEAAGLVF